MPAFLRRLFGRRVSVPTGRGGPAPAPALLDKATLRRELIAIARSEVGVREFGGNNRGKRIREYQAATWLDIGPWPWCAAFVCWVIREWLRDDSVAISAGIVHPEKWRPQTPRAFDFKEWARKEWLTVLPPDASVLAGDIVVFDFSHVGFVNAAAARGDSHIQTVEGNTNAKGDRDSPAGDGVRTKTRPRSLVLHFIRIVS